jgi:hypothetical protein
MNTTERDHILFGPTPPVYSGGVARFTGLTLEKIQLLLEKGMLDPAYSHNCSPESQDYIDFMEAHPEFTAHGYAYGPERIGKEWRWEPVPVELVKGIYGAGDIIGPDVDPAHTIVLEGIKAKRQPTDPPFDPDIIRDFVLRYRHADEFEWETDHLYCWYD